MALIPEYEAHVEPQVRNLPVKGDAGRAGGGALLRGLAKRFTDKINIQFHVAEDPLRAVARGTGIALKNVNKFSFLIR